MMELKHCSYLGILLVLINQYTRPTGVFVEFNKLKDHWARPHASLVEVESI